MPDPHHRTRPPAPTIARWATRVAPNATVLDVAAGGGRHSVLFADRGHHVAAVDRDTAALRALHYPHLEVLEADLEGAAWPLAGQRFGAVVVVDYLWRPLLPTLVDTVAAGGLLLYETFAAGNERFGRPRNPDFLLRSGELLAAVQDRLEVLEYAHGEVGTPPQAVRQRLLARRVP